MFEKRLFIFPKATHVQTMIDREETGQGPDGGNPQPYTIKQCYEMELCKLHPD